MKLSKTRKIIFKLKAIGKKNNSSEHIQVCFKNLFLFFYSLNMLDYLRKITGLFNNIPSLVIVYFSVMACYAGFQLYGGEEQYLAFAKQFMNPEWIPGSHCLTHPAGGNFCFQVIVGFLLKYISFENMAFWGRTVSFLLLALPMVKILKYLRLSNIEIGVLLLAFYIPHQSLYAGEWIFQDFEVKTLAYIFVLVAYYLLFKGKIVSSILLTVPATYFHFLVGGWNFVVIFTYFLLHSKNYRQIALAVLLYTVGVMPFMVYLASLYFIDNASVVDGVNVNWVYAYERLSHHLALFKNWHEFKRLHLDGVLVSLAFFILCIFLFCRYKNRHIQQLNTLNIILYAFQFVFLIIAVFDTNGTILKIYPFRINALSTLFSFIEIALVLHLYFYPWLLRIIKKGKNKDRKTDLSFYIILRSVFLMLFIIVFISEIIQTFQGKNTDLPKLPDGMVEMAGYIKQNTTKGDVFLVFEKDHPLSFHRLAERKRFVVWKFTPTKSEAIYDWYQRYLIKERLLEDITVLEELSQKYKVDYLISTETLNSNLITEQKKTGDVILYKIKNRQETVKSEP